MAKSILEIKIFLGSPSDGAEERKIAEDVIQNLNVSFFNEMDVYLNLIKWETNAYPGVTTSGDAQSIINEQIVRDFDIFIGIMWKKFGYKTQKAGSGTEEEFDIAYKKYVKDNQTHILFYFCLKPISVNEIDTVEINKINIFKDKLKAHNVLYWQYTDVDDFKTNLQKHITKSVLEFKKKKALSIIKFSVLRDSVPGISWWLPPMFFRSQDDNPIYLCVDGSKKYPIYPNNLLEIDLETGIHFFYFEFSYIVKKSSGASRGLRTYEVPINIRTEEETLHFLPGNTYSYNIKLDGDIFGDWKINYRKKP